MRANQLPPTSEEDANHVIAAGRWSGMIPAILELGSRDFGDELDLAEQNELFAMGMIDAPDDDRRPVLTTFGLAVYEYLTRL